jgi:hypothetical protein
MWAKSSHGLNGLLGFQWKKQAMEKNRCEIRAIRGCFLMHVA